MLEAKVINLDDYVYAGEGAVGKSYNKKDNPALMLKMFNADAPQESSIRELEMARKVFNAGIPTPQPGEYVTDGNGSYGIQFERIVGKKSYSRATSDDFSNVEKYGREFGQLCKELHNIHLEKDYTVDVKDKYRQFLADNQFFTDEEKEKVAAFISSVPDSDIANHGDLQFSNAIRVESEDGSEVAKYFIDLGDFAMGHPYFDLGQVLLCCMYEDEEFSQTTFHLTCAQAAEFWRWFVKGYWGDDADPDEWEKIIKPFAGLKVLLIQHYFPVPFPQYKKILLDNI